MVNTENLLGVAIAQRRKRMGLTQEELAEQAGLSQQYLSELERGAKTNVSLSTLSRIAVALGTSVTALLTPTPTPEEAATNAA